MNNNKVIIWHYPTSHYLVLLESSSLLLIIVLLIVILILFILFRSGILSPTWFPWPWRWNLWRWVQIQPRKVFIIKYWCLSLHNPLWWWIKVIQGYVSWCWCPVQQLVTPQPKIVLDIDHIIQPFVFQTVSFLGVYTLKYTPIAFTSRSTAWLAQYSNCKIFQFTAAPTKLPPPIGCNKSWMQTSFSKWLWKFNSNFTMG